MRKQLLTVLLMLVASIAAAQTEEVIFSAPGGFYEDSFPLSLECYHANHHIRYTTNGNSPTPNSTRYTEPLVLNGTLHSTSDIYTIVNCIPSVYHPTDSVRHCIVIRAAVFDENDSCVSAVATHSYFIRSLGCDTHGMPVLSLAADSLSLFDYETGIFIPGVHYDPADSTHTGNYCEKGREWERPINMEFYETDNSGINQPCGLRTHGGSSRWFQQKGLRLYAREEYGKKKFHHRFFATTTVEKFKHLNLHPFRCSNWLQTGGQEHLSQTVAATLDIDALGVRQTLVFLNGEYWGIYTLEESPDEHYVEDHYGYDDEQVNLLKYWGVTQNGDGTDWWQFFNWISDADLSQPDQAAYAYSRIDVPSFIDYVLFETYTANLDWPQNNVLHWQGETGEPFRWLFYDADGCFTRPSYNALEHATSLEGSSMLINKFLENEAFRDSFFQRYVELLDAAFSVPYLLSVLDDYQQTVEGEIPLQSERFGFPTDLQRWNDDLEEAKTFFRTRNYYYQQELSTHIATINNVSASFFCAPNPSQGSFWINIHSNDNAILPLAIYDTMGRLVYTTDLYLFPTENVIPLHPALSSGLYLVRIGDVTHRLVIAK